MSIINFDEISDTLMEKDGIWFSSSSSNISYPEDGHSTCYEIEDQSFWFEHRNNCILTAIKNFPPIGSVFDIGGGNGFVSENLKRYGYEVVLVEPGIEGILNARKRGITNLICSTFEDARLKKNSLPAVGLFDVLEHIDDDYSFLEKVFDSMSIGSKLYLTVPAYPFLWSYEDHYAGHYRRYTLDSLTRKLRACGFLIVYQTYLFSLLPIPIFLFRTLPSMVPWRGRSDWQRFNNEHKKRKALSGRIIEKLLSVELALLRTGRKILIGSSCLVIAQKISLTSSSCQ